MLKKLFSYHILPIGISILLVGGIVALDTSFRQNNYVQENTVIEGKSEMRRGVHYNLLAGEQAEIDFISSIKTKGQLTIFGSSEFTDSPFAPYHFLPDSVGIPAIGLGHGFHQELSILCELLAADEYLEGSEVCIILSPGWFATQGTNIEAFIEFVRPNFLNRIVSNENIDEKYKTHIGRYIHKNYNNISGVSHSMNALRDFYMQKSSSPFLNGKVQLQEKIMGKRPINEITYLIHDSIKAKKIRPYPNYEELKHKTQALFVSQITTNNVFINDDYFTKYVADENGEAKPSEVGQINTNNCPELDDFRLLMDYLEEKKVNASFIIQPFNPYQYSGLEKNLPLIEELENTIKSKSFPYLNLYTADKNNYEAGTLTDVMHLGDYGWLIINEFLEKTYR